MCYIPQRLLKPSAHMGTPTSPAAPLMHHDDKDLCTYSSFDPKDFEPDPPLPAPTEREKTAFPIKSVLVLFLIVP